MKATLIMIFGLLLPLAGSAQWSKGRAGEFRYHCALCRDVADLSLTPGVLSMQGAEWCDITLYDSIGRTVVEWKGVGVNDSSSVAVVGDLHRFVAHRSGYVELLLYRPLQWSPSQYESFTYIIPTIRKEKEEYAVF